MHEAGLRTREYGFESPSHPAAGQWHRDSHRLAYRCGGSARMALDGRHWLPVSPSGSKTPDGTSATKMIPTRGRDGQSKYRPGAMKTLYARHNVASRGFGTERALTRPRRQLYLSSRQRCPPSTSGLNRESGAGCYMNPRPELPRSGIQERPWSWHWAQAPGKRPPLDRIMLAMISA
jgi:hypothetical protein